MPGIIFDLDQTLVDSSSAETFRKARNWPQTYTLISSFVIYDGLADLFQYIRDKHIKICVVTTSPSTYCRRVLDYWSIPYHYTVCYHDVSNRKPHPESFLKAIQFLGDDRANIVSLGDRAIDIEASKATNVKSIGCLWGTAEKPLLIESKPDYLAEVPAQALTYIRSLF